MLPQIFFRNSSVFPQNSEYISVFSEAPQTFFPSGSLCHLRPLHVRPAPRCPQAETISRQPDLARPSPWHTGYSERKWPFSADKLWHHATHHPSCRERAIQKQPGFPLIGNKQKCLLKQDTEIFSAVRSN